MVIAKSAAQSVKGKHTHTKKMRASDSDVVHTSKLTKSPSRTPSARSVCSCAKADNESSEGRAHASIMVDAEATMVALCHPPCSDTRLRRKKEEAINGDALDIISQCNGVQNGSQEGRRPQNDATKSDATSEVRTHAGCPNGS